MRDEIYDREYQAGRAELHSGIDRAILCLAHGLAATFGTLHALRWAAQWRQTPRGHGGRPGTA